MADNTKIEWADATANYVNGCSVISPGCTNCYAMRLAGTRMKNHPTRAGLTTDSKAGPVWNGTIRTNDKVLAEVLGWKAARRIFWNAHGDLFHENVSDDIIDRQFAVMALTPHHTHMVLTKRSARMRKYLTDAATPHRIARAIIDAALADSKLLYVNPWPVRTVGDIDEPTEIDVALPLPNVWLGVSVEDQARADERIPDLLATPAAIRFISAEPLLGPLDLNRIHQVFDDGLGHSWESCLNGKRFDPWTDFDCDPMRSGHPKIDWVIAGGESGPNARPMHPDWARSLRDQCAAAGVAFHFKQWGEWGLDTGQLDEYHPNSTIKKDPIFEGKTKCAVLVEGQWRHFADAYCVPDEFNSGHEWIYRIGKARAGRLLDGRTHDEFPS